MKFLKTIIAAMVIAFSTTNCADLQAFLDGLVPDTSSIVDDITSSFYNSEGSIASPVNIGINSSWGGAVDGTNSSFYYTYTGYMYSYWTVELSPYNGDADLYTYGDNYMFTGATCFSMNSGTSMDSCNDYSSNGDLYYEVRPVDTAGTAYGLYVY